MYYIAAKRATENDYIEREVKKPLHCTLNSNVANIHDLLNAIFKVVSLAFNYFYTQPESDVVLIYDGNSTSAPLIARLHGASCTAPGPFVSTQQYMFVRFLSDSSVNVNGFSAAVQTLTFGGHTYTVYSNYDLNRRHKSLISFQSLVRVFIIEEITLKKKKKIIGRVKNVSLIEIELHYQCSHYVLARKR